MKLGFLTACLPQVPLENLVPWAASQEFETLELAAWPVKSTRDYQARQLDAAGLKSAEAEKIKNLFDTHNMAISALAYYDNNLDPNPRKRKYYHDHLKKVIQAASLLGVNLVGTFVGGRLDKLPAENMKEIGKEFRRILKYAEDRGVRVMIENCPMDGWQRFTLPGNFAFSPELWQALFEEVPSPNFGLNFDPSHLYWLGIDYVRAAREFGTKIFHAHAKDCEFLPEGQYRYGIFGQQIKPTPWKSGWWRYRMPGQGKVNWKEFITTLRSVGYDYVLSIEHEDPEWEGSEEKVKKGLQMGREFLAKVSSAI
ncbi:MAG: sugar phosphate isomerase/epimerase [Ignavibacteriales bacterium]|nr:sugar phosphate isomerase/epimerase [Ignavibacteriales bacterium]